MSSTEKHLFLSIPPLLLFHIKWYCNTQVIICSYVDLWSSLLSCSHASKKCMNTWINERVNLITQNLKWHSSASKNLILFSVSFFSSHIKPISRPSSNVPKIKPHIFWHFIWLKDLSVPTAQHKWTFRLFPLEPRRVKAVSTEWCLPARNTPFLTTTGTQTSANQNGHHFVQCGCTKCECTKAVGTPFSHSHHSHAQAWTPVTAKDTTAFIFLPPLVSLRSCWREKSK